MRDQSLQAPVVLVSPQMLHEYTRWDAVSFRPGSPGESLSLHRPQHWNGSNNVYPVARARNRNDHYFCIYKYILRTAQIQQEAIPFSFALWYPLALPSL